jgi:general secretion pathway protein D
VFADGVLNRLVIRTTPRTYASIKALLDRLDVVPAQVLLQVLVVEVTLTESTNFGWNSPRRQRRKPQLAVLAPATATSPRTAKPSRTAPPFLLNDPDNPENKFGYIRALDGYTAIKVISSPQLLVRATPRRGSRWAAVFRIFRRASPTPRRKAASPRPIDI